MPGQVGVCSGTPTSAGLPIPTAWPVSRVLAHLKAASGGAGLPAWRTQAPGFHALGLAEGLCPGF